MLLKTKILVMIVMNILALQFDIIWEDKEANFATVRRLLSQNPPLPNTLLVLPEMFATGFSMNPAIVEREEGTIMQFLREIAQEFSIFVVGGVALHTPHGNQNQAITFAPSGEKLAVYAKQYPFTLGGEVYTPGTQGQTFLWNSLTVAPFVCYDLRFPEIFRAVAAQNQPHLYLIIASWSPTRIHHWIRLLQARAIENQAYVLGVNRTGSDPNMLYVGRSIFIDFHGEILADAGEKEGVIRGNLDTEALLEYRAKFPFLKDIR